MKSLQIIIAIVCLTSISAYTCTAQNVESEVEKIHKTSTENTNNSSIINSVYDLFSKGDIPAVLALMDDKIVWNEAESNSLADGNPYIGPEAVLNGVFARIGGKYESFTLKDVKLHEMKNDQVLATLYYVLHMKNGKIYTVQAAHHWTLKDGKIIAFQQYADTKKLAESEEQ